MDEHSTRTMPERFRRAGYDQEEEYFFRKNQQAIREVRERLDAQRRSLHDAQSAASHWMRCPKCGNGMHEHESLGVKSEVCVACHGVFLDHAELELLMGSRGSKSIVDALRDMLGEATRPLPTGIGQFPV